jgi:hypothetical protein
MALTAEIKDQFSRLASELSPENLCCDGELRGARLKAKKNRLVKEWQALEKKAGVKVTEEDTFKWWMEKNGR